MSDNKLTKIDNSLTDFSDLDLEKIEQFKLEGMPGLAKIKDVEVKNIVDLYLSGKSYTQISKVTRLPRVLIMYLSEKWNWFDLKLEFIEDIEANHRNRITESKIRSQDFLLDVQMMYEKKIGKKINKYFATNDDSSVESIDPKDLEKYLKVIEILHKVTAISASQKGSDQSKQPAIGLNVGDGVTIERTNKDTMEITPKQKIVSSVLKDLADKRRREEKK